MTAKLTSEYNSVKLRAMQATLPEGKHGNASIRAAIVRNDNEAGDHVKAYDEMQLRLLKVRAAKKLILEEKKAKEEKEAKEEEEEAKEINNDTQIHAVSTN